MTFLLSRGKHQWAVKVSAISGKWFWSYSDRQQEEQNNGSVLCLYRKKITGARLIDHNSRVQWGTELVLVPFYSP